MSRTLPLVLVALAAVAAMSLAWAATKHGAATSKDSLQYARAADSIRDGHGSATSAVVEGRVVYEPVSWWPPLYPAVLGSASRVTGVPVLTVSRVMNTGLLGLTVLLAAGATADATRHVRLRRLEDDDHNARTFWPAAATAWLIAAQPMVLRNYIHVWTEPLFVTLTFTAIWLTARHVRQPMWWTPGVLGLLAGLAYLTRYAGLSMVVGVPMLLMLMGPMRVRGFPRRAIEAATAFGIGFAFVIGWIWRNTRLGSDATGRDGTLDVSIAERFDILAANLAGIADQAFD